MAVLGTNLSGTNQATSEVPLPTIINDSDFGAIEIAPIKNPEVRQKAKALLGRLRQPGHI